MSDFDQTSLHEELEVRVIALLTGELSEAEADELEKILSVNPELSAFRDRMAGLMGEMHQSRDELAAHNSEAPSRLSEDRREKIFGDTSVLEPRGSKRRPRLMAALGGVAASILMLFIVGLLSSVQFSSSVLHEQTAFEAVPLSAPDQAAPEYNVNVEQRNRPTPTTRATMTVNEPSGLGVPSLDIDVKEDSSSVYGRGGGSFAADGLKRLDRDVAVTTFGMDAKGLAKQGETIPVDIPKERIEGTPQRIVVPNLKPAPTTEPRMIVEEEEKAKQQAWKWDGEDQDEATFARSGTQLTSRLGDANDSRAAGVSGSGEGGVDPFASALPVQGRLDGVVTHEQEFGSRGPVDAFAAPSRKKNSKQADLGLKKEKDEFYSLDQVEVASTLELDSRRGAVAEDALSLGGVAGFSGPVDHFGASSASRSRLESEVAELSGTERADYLNSAGTGKSREVMLRGVEHSWERPKVSDLASDASPQADSALNAKLNEIVIPQVNFSGVPMSQVVEELNELTKAYDPEQKGLQIEYDSEAMGGADPRVNISLRNLNLDRVLQFVTQQVNLSYDVGGDAISIQPSDSLAGVASTSTAYIPISRETLVNLIAGYDSDAAPQPADPFSDLSEAKTSAGVNKENDALKSFFQSAGINHELPGTSMAFDGENLIVTQTPRNLERIRRVVRDYEKKLEAKKAAQAVRLEPKPEKLAKEEPVSTFSLNVSDVSFKLAQAALENSRVPQSTQIRTEEFVNSFDYRDPSPRVDEPVSLNWEVAQHPFEHDRQVVRFSLQTRASGRASGQPLNISLLVDNSGSMQRPDRQAILQNSLQALEEKLTPKDKLNIIMFARQPRLIAEANTRESQKAAVETALAYRPEGGTNLEAGLKAAYETAQRNYLPSGSNRVILMTDGAANLGNVKAGDLAEYVIDQRKQGIALDAYGIGWDDYNDALLEEITRNGDGRYAFLNSVEDASEDFSEKLAGTLRVAAANVKVQIEWNPERVTRYRQIGYDLHQLKKEDFRDNTVDAAEIGEAESGTALYVLKIDEDPEIIGGLGTLRVRYQDPSTGLYKERSWPLPMPRSIPAADKASPSMRLAMTSAFFGERLANNPYAGGYDLNDLYKMTTGLPDAFPKQPRVRELQTMLLQASELYGEK